MKRFGHLIILPDNTPVKPVLKYLNKRKDLGKGSPEKNKRKKLKVYDFNWDLAIEMSLDREHRINCCNKIYFRSKNLPDIF